MVCGSNQESPVSDLFIEGPVACLKVIVRAPQSVPPTNESYEFTLGL